MKINTQDYNVYLDIDDDIDVIFKLVGDADTFLLKQAISELDITNDRAVIMFWAAAGRFYNQPECVNMLNEFHRSIKNPVVLFSGALNVTSDTLELIHEPINLFQYIAKSEQPLERSITFNKTKKFIYTSTKDYTSRCFILQHLINNNYAGQGTISYRCLYQNRQFEHFLNVPVLQDACATIDHLLPYGGLTGETDDVINYINKPEHLVNDAYLSIITETYYHGPVFLSEKIFYSMLYNHFFIFYGPKGSLQYLRSLGFKTFSHVIDESYDNIDDPVDRLLSVVRSLDEFLRKPLAEMDKLYRDNLEIFEHNRKLVLQTDITAQVNSALRRAIKNKI